jgi:hypothetical protein
MEIYVSLALLPQAKVAKCLTIDVFGIILQEHVKTGFTED